MPAREFILEFTAYAPPFLPLKRVEFVNEERTMEELPVTQMYADTWSLAHVGDVLRQAFVDLTESDIDEFKALKYQTLGRALVFIEGQRQALAMCPDPGEESQRCVMRLLVGYLAATIAKRGAGLRVADWLKDRTPPFLSPRFDEAELKALAKPGGEDMSTINVLLDKIIKQGDKDVHDVSGGSIGHGQDDDGAVSGQTP